MSDKVKKQEHLFSVLSLLIASACTYLPLLGKFGYYNDDWYLMYSASAYGPSTFVDIFSVDRPGRALVMIPAYVLFGDNPLYYNLSAYSFRVLGALALYWLLNMLWPGKRTSTTLMSLLFILYPGFLSQPNAIDYQSHIIALAAALFSVAMTLKAVITERQVLSWLWHGLSLVLGWLYLSQMEWYIGFEFFRWACVFLLSVRVGGTLLQKISKTVHFASPSLLIPIAFLAWRLLLFKSERAATDTDIQFELVRLYPIQTIAHWFLQIIQDLFDVLVSAWAIPINLLKENIQLWGVVLAVGVVAFLLWALYRIHRTEAGDLLVSKFVGEALLLGLSSAALGLLPVIMANREVAFPFFSRYSLVSSVGASIFLAALLVQMNGRWLRSALISVLLLIAILTHHANSVSHARETDTLRTFWWQVSWRAPQMEPRTTLIANYPGSAIEEDYFIWGPANLIYYPKALNVRNIQPALFASVLNRETVSNVLARERQKYDNRKNIITYPNYRNILVLSQPSDGSCVHVLNGFQPEFSRNESDSIRVIGPFSELEHILVDQTALTPPALIFGPEPTHSWCYYYQKADLARQNGDWDAVLQIGEQAFSRKLVPRDDIEWMPFLQAYAWSGDVNRLADLAPRIVSNPYVARQVCQVIGSMQDISASTQESLHSLYCTE